MTNRRISVELGSLSRETAFGARDLVVLIEGDGLSEGQGKGFEGGFDLVVVILTAQNVDVEGHACVDGEGLQPMNEVFTGDIADFFTFEIEMDLGPRPTREVDNSACKGFVEGGVCVSKTTETALFSEGLFESLAEQYRAIFGSMVIIDVEIALAAQVEIEASVFGECVEHVVEKAEARLDIGESAAVEIEREGDIGFLCFALNADLARCHGVYSEVERSERRGFWLLGRNINSAIKVAGS